LLAVDPVDFSDDEAGEMTLTGFNQSYFTENRKAHEKTAGLMLSRFRDKLLLTLFP
jgi:hypothetical protein